MPARSQIGDIFLGVTPSGIRQYMRMAFAGARERYSRLVIPCAGRFTIAEAAVDAGWAPEQIETSDVTLFSSLLGAWSSTGSIVDLNVNFRDELTPLAALQSEFPIGAVLIGLKLCQLRPKSYFENMVRTEILRAPGVYAAQLQEKVDELAKKLNGIGYAAMDVTEHCKRVADDPKTVVYCNPPGFSNGYCLAPTELILMADLTWRRAGDVCAGDEILGFDEFPIAGRLRRWRWATVTHSRPARRKCVRVHLATGESVVCTEDHPWLSGANGRDAAREWRAAAALAPGKHHVLKVLAPWRNAADFDSGWLSGMLDGEGSLTLPSPRSPHAACLMISQKPGAIFDRAASIFRAHGFDVGLSSAASKQAQGRPTHECWVRGGLAEILRALGTFRPQRLLGKLRNNGALCGLGVRCQSRDPRVEVVDVEPIGMADIQSLETSTATYVGAGYLMHNTKMFDTHGMITWADPQIPEFEAEKSRKALYDLLMPAPALAYFFRSKAPEPGFEDKAVFALDRTKVRDFVLCNRPDEAKLLVRPRRETRIARGPVPLLPEGYEVQSSGKIGYLKVDKSVALYYRDLFAHKLPTTRAEQYYIATLDGYLMAVFGMFFSEVMRNQSGTVYEVFGFCAPNKRYPRINHLFMSSLVCEDARRFFTEQCGSLREVERFQTTCISVTPEQKSHRSTGLKLTSREEMPDGRFKLVYAGPFKTLTMRQTIDKWLDGMRNVEKQTGKAMGVGIVSRETVPESDAA